MHLVVVFGVENSQEDESSGPNDGPHDSQRAQNLFGLSVILDKLSLVTKPSLQDEDEVEGHDSNGAGSDEDGLAPACRTDIRDVDNVLAGRVHVRIVWLALGYPGAKHREKAACRHKR